MWINILNKTNDVKSHGHNKQLTIADHNKLCTKYQSFKAWQRIIYLEQPNVVFSNCKYTRDTRREWRMNCTESEGAASKSPRRKSIECVDKGQEAAVVDLPRGGESLLFCRVAIDVKRLCPALSKARCRERRMADPVDLLPRLREKQKIK